MESYRSLKKSFDDLKRKHDNLEKIDDALLDLFIKELTETAKSSEKTGSSASIMLKLLEELKIERDFHKLSDKVYTYIDDDLLDLDPPEYMC